MSFARAQHSKAARRSKSEKQNSSSSRERDTALRVLCLLLMATLMLLCSTARASQLVESAAAAAAVACQSTSGGGLCGESRSELDVVGKQDDDLQARRMKRRAKLAANLMPEFSAPIGNVSAVLGRDVRLVCTVEHLGQYQVAWLKEESKTILSIDTNIITTNYRIFLIPDEEERKWVLHIKDVQEVDRGFYQCQVNTIPMRTSSGYLEVVVPPTIIESQSSQVAEVIEHSNVSIQCKAEGHPRPIVSWRRDDGLPIRLNGKPTDNTQTHDNQLADHGGEESSASLEQANDFSMIANKKLPTQSTTIMGSLLDDVKSDRLTLYNVDRSMGGIYTCTASNGIPSQAMKKIPIYVKFAPKTSIHSRYIYVNLGDPLEIDCIIEAFPKANSYWSKKPLMFNTTMTMLPFQDHYRNSRVIMNKPASSSSSGASAGPLSRWTSVTADRRAISSQRLKLPPDNQENHHVDPTASYTNLHNQLEPVVHQPPVFIQHPHNRIHFRQADYSNQPALSVDDMLAPGATNFAKRNFKFNQDDGSTTSAASGLVSDENETSFSTNANTAQRQPYFTVKPSAINSYTYKLKLIISKMRADYLGEYSCTSSNSMGTSVSSVIVSKVEKNSENSREQKDTDDEKEVERESGQQHHQHHHQTSSTSGGTRRSSSGNHVVYDEKYLEAIKFRQSGNTGSMSSAAASGRLQQKLKKQSERNRASNKIGNPFSSLVITCLAIMISYILIYTRV